MNGDLPIGACPAQCGPWTRLSRTVAYENQWITVYHDQVVRPDGLPGVYGVVHFRNESAGVVVLDDRGWVLLVGQYRYTTGKYSWEIPAGGTHGDESPLDAARRELLEEGGVRAKTWELISTTYTSNSVCDERARCFLATDLEIGTARPEGTELIEKQWVPLDEAVRMVACGNITDALSVVGLYSAAHYRLYGSTTGG